MASRPSSTCSRTTTSAASSRRACGEHGLQQVLFNAPPGDWEARRTRHGRLPGREAEFRAGFDRRSTTPQALDCPRVHVMAGLAPQAPTREAAAPLYVANLAGPRHEAASAGRRRC